MLYLAVCADRHTGEWLQDLCSLCQCRGGDPADCGPVRWEVPADLQLVGESVVLLTAMWRDVAESCDGTLRVLLGMARHGLWPPRWSAVHAGSQSPVVAVVDNGVGLLDRVLVLSGDGFFTCVQRLYRC